MGSEKSTKALMLYPVVFLMRNLSRIRCVRALSPAISSRISSIARIISAWDARKERRESGSAVSSTVPSWKMIFMLSTVR